MSGTGTGAGTGTVSETETGTVSGTVSGTGTETETAGTGTVSGTGTETAGTETAGTGTAGTETGTGTGLGLRLRLGLRLGLRSGLGSGLEMEKFGANRDPVTIHIPLCCLFFIEKIVTLHSQIEAKFHICIFAPLLIRTPNQNVQILNEKCIIFNCRTILYVFRYLHMNLPLFFRSTPCLKSNSRTARTLDLGVGLEQLSDVLGRNWSCSGRKSGAHVTGERSVPVQF